MKESKFRAWDKEEKNFMYFDATDGLKSECDDTYIRLNVRKIEQYTGLKDSVAHEEYFGDIIHEHGDVNSVIEDGSSAVLYRDIKTGGIKYFWELRPHEVIGNIHENPELLDKIQ